MGNGHCRGLPGELNAILDLFVRLGQKVVLNHNRDGRIRTGDLLLPKQAD